MEPNKDKATKAILDFIIFITLKLTIRYDLYLLGHCLVTSEASQLGLSTDGRWLRGSA